MVLLFSSLMLLCLTLKTRWLPFFGTNPWGLYPFSAQVLGLTACKGFAP